MHRFKRRTYEELAFNYDNEEPPEDAHFEDDPEGPDEFYPESEEFEFTDGPR